MIFVVVQAKSRPIAQSRIPPQDLQNNLLDRKFNLKMTQVVQNQTKKRQLHIHLTSYQKIRNCWRNRISLCGKSSLFTPVSKGKYHMEEDLQIQSNHNNAKWRLNLQVLKQTTNKFKQIAYELERAEA